MGDVGKPDIRSLRLRLKEQITNLEVSAARYDAGWAEEADRLAVVVRILVHDTRQSTSLFAQMNVKKKMHWIDSNGGMDTRRAIFFTSLVLYSISSSNGQSTLKIMPVPQKDILARGRLIDFASWWKRFPIMIANGESITRFDIVDMLANHDGGAHVDLTKQKFNRILHSVPVMEPFASSGTISSRYQSLITDNTEEMQRMIVRAAMRTIAEEIWLDWNNQLDLLDPDWKKNPIHGGRIGPNDPISGIV